ncbi:hypothetical protein B566_EDAN007456 [Ephemera danica]|nr:hypothetical protein B566_EDAN007456 [Ephemera danica]
MAISCGAKCARSILLTFNLVFWLSGCTLLVLGVWLIVEPDAGRLINVVAPIHLPPNLHIPLAYVLAALGAAILLVGFIGCCGALQESRCLLAVYNCCGVNGDDDYMTSRWLNETSDGGKITKNVPTTCCILKNGNVSYPAGSPISVVSRVFYGHVEEPWQNPQPLSETACQDTAVHTFETARHRLGCLHFTQEEFKRDTLIIIATCLIAAAIEVLGMVFSICLCRNINEDI